jgi:hypothetical protein
MRDQKRHASRVALRLIAIVVINVLRREEALSIQRPSDEAKRIAARLVEIPLRYHQY